MNLVFQKSLAFSLVVSSSLLLTACNQSALNMPIVNINQNSNTNNTIPSWYIKPSSNNTNFLYGIGSASTLKDAKNEALNSMASRLSVSINSNVTTITKSSSSGSYNKSNVKKLQLDVEKIEFNNYKILKSKMVNNTYYVLLSVDRKELYKQTFDQLKELDRKIDNIYNQLSNQSPLESLKVEEEFFILLQKADAKINNLVALNRDFDKEQFSIKYDKIKLDFSKIKDSLKFSVNSKSFSKPIISFLTNNDLKVVDNNSNVKFDIIENIQYSNYNGWKIAKCNILIKVISNNKTLNSKNISVTGRSTSSNQSALQNANKSLVKKLNKLDIEEFLY
jgi:hypothetical protein